MGEAYYKIPCGGFGEGFVKASNYQIERARLHKKNNFSIGIIGLGKVGTLSANEIFNLKLPYSGLDIKSLVLFSRDTNKSIGIANQLSDKSKNDFPILAGTLDDILTTDICVLAVDSDKNKEYINRCLREKIIPNRTEMAFNNLELIKYFASCLKDYKGLIINVTNHTDILSYFLARYSGLNPFQIVGLNHTDSLRAKAFLIETLKTFEKEGLSKKELNIFTIGSHDENMIPVISGAHYKGLGIDALGYVDWQTLIRDMKMRAVEEMAFCKDTSIITAEAIADVIRAAMTETERVSMSCYTDFFRLEYRGNKPQSPLFIGRPIYFDNLKISDFSPFKKEDREKRENWFDYLADQEKEQFIKAGLRLESIINNIEANRKVQIVIEKIPEPIPKPVEIKKRSESGANKPVFYFVSGTKIYKMQNGEISLFEDINEDVRSATIINGNIYVGLINEIMKIDLKTKRIEIKYLKRNHLRHGFNSVAVLGNSIYATHSDIGLVKIDEHGNYHEIYQRGNNQVTRFAGVYEGNIVFSSGNAVFEYDGKKVRQIFKGPDLVTGLDYEHKIVLNREGELYSLDGKKIDYRKELYKKIAKGDLTKIGDLSKIANLNDIIIIHFSDNIIAGSRDGWIYQIENGYFFKHSFGGGIRDISILV